MIHLLPVCGALASLPPCRSAADTPHRLPSHAMQAKLGLKPRKRAGDGSGRASKKAKVRVGG